MRVNLECQMAGEGGSDATALRNNQMSGGKICVANHTPPKCKASSSYCVFGSCVSVPDCGSGRVVSPLLLTESLAQLSYCPCSSLCCSRCRGIPHMVEKGKTEATASVRPPQNSSHTEFGLSRALLITQQVAFCPKPSKHPPSLRTTDASVAQT